jgi:hypothetical protein
MNTTSILYRQNKVKVMSMQVMNQVFAIEHLFQVPDTKPTGTALQRLRRCNMPDGYGFHSTTKLICFIAPEKP